MNSDDPKDSHGGSIEGYIRIAEMMSGWSQRQATQRAAQEQRLALAKSQTRAINMMEEAVALRGNGPVSLSLSGFDAANLDDDRRNRRVLSKSPRLKAAREYTGTASPYVKAALKDGDREPNSLFAWGHFNEAISIREFARAGHTVLSGQTPTGISAQYRRPFSSDERQRYSAEQLDRFSRKGDALLHKGGFTSVLEVKSGKQIKREHFEQISDYGKMNPRLAKNLTLASMSTVQETDKNFFRAGRNVQHQFDRQWHDAGQRGNRRVVRARTDEMTPGTTAPVRLMGYRLARHPEILGRVFTGHQQKQRRFADKQKTLTSFIKKSGWPAKPSSSK